MFVLMYATVDRVENALANVNQANIASLMATPTVKQCSSVRLGIQSEGARRHLFRMRIICDEVWPLACGTERQSPNGCGDCRYVNR